MEEEAVNEVKEQSEHKLKDLSTIIPPPPTKKNLCETKFSRRILFAIENNGIRFHYFLEDLSHFFTGSCRYYYDGYKHIQEPFLFVVIVISPFFVSSLLSSLFSPRSPLPLYRRSTLITVFFLNIVDRKSALHVSDCNGIRNVCKIIAEYIILGDLFILHNSLKLKAFYQSENI